MPYFCNPKTGDSLAQQVEHNTFNVGVLGSSPRRITKKPSEMEAFLLYNGWLTFQILNSWGNLAHLNNGIHQADADFPAALKCNITLWL